MKEATNNKEQIIKETRTKVSIIFFSPSMVSSIVKNHPQLLLSVAIIVATFTFAPLLPSNHRSFAVFLGVMLTLVANWELYVWRRLFRGLGVGFTFLYGVFALSSLTAPIAGKLLAASHESPLITFVFAAFIANVWLMVCIVIANIIRWVRGVRPSKLREAMIIWGCVIVLSAAAYHEAKWGG